MKPYRIVMRNIDGTGARRCRVFDLAPAAGMGYWSAVTDVLCPSCGSGLLRWAEAGHVPGYRICDRCRRHYLADGDHAHPSLVLLAGRRVQP
jgi:hypothetical protein